jgi:hypothetical protein
VRLGRRLSVSFKWYDFWVGAYYDDTPMGRKLYVCPVPMVVFGWDFD